MNHVTMLAQSLDAKNPGNFFFALPIKGTERTNLGPKAIFCENTKGVVKGYRVYSLDSNVVNSEPPMGRATWLTYGQVVMFDRGSKDMSIISIKTFMDINPEFDVMEVLTHCMARSDLAQVLEMKMGISNGLGAQQDPHVKNTGMRDITGQSELVNKTRQ